MESPRLNLSKDLAYSLWGALFRNAWRVCVEEQSDDPTFNPPSVLLCWRPKGSNTLLPALLAGSGAPHSFTRARMAFPNERKTDA
jgi:hypothetical protein